MRKELLEAYNTIDVFKLDPRAKIPTRHKSDDAGADLYALEDVFIPLGSTTIVKTGIALRVPQGCVGLLKERSSIGKKGLKVAGGVIDAGYSGDVSVMLMNISNGELLDPHMYGTQYGYQVKAGDRIAQILILPVYTLATKEVDVLWTSERGSGGFGSSGS